MHKKSSFRFIVILLFQCLLLLKITVPVLHCFVHGTEEAICGDYTLCLFSKAATEKKESSKLIEIKQLSLVEILPAYTIAYHFVLQAGITRQVYPSYDATLTSIALALVPPPPKY